jgi:hypothetical protein
MSLGNTCPTGFEPLDEGELQPLQEWLDVEPSVRAKKGNYPRTGSELTGSPLHTANDTYFEDVVNESVDFESFNGRLYTEFSNSEDNWELGVTPTVFTVSTDNPATDRAVVHRHTLSEAKTRPVSIGLMFCKRQ